VQHSSIGYERSHYNSICLQRAPPGTTGVGAPPPDPPRPFGAGVTPYIFTAHDEPYAVTAPPQPCGGAQSPPSPLSRPARGLQTSRGGAGQWVHPPSPSRRGGQNENGQWPPGVRIAWPFVPHPPFSLYGFPTPGKSEWWVPGGRFRRPRRKPPPLFPVSPECPVRPKRIPVALAVPWPCRGKPSARICPPRHAAGRPRTGPVIPERPAPIRGALGRPAFGPVPPRAKRSGRKSAGANPQPPPIRAGAPAARRTFPWPPKSHRKPFGGSRRTRNDHNLAPRPRVRPWPRPFFFPAATGKKPSGRHRPLPKVPGRPRPASRRKRP